MAEPSGNLPGPPHAARTVPRTTHADEDKVDAPFLSFRPYFGSVVTRTRNVSEYMLVLALCLVNYL